jgi:aryl-alcohol dehydrogenase-like predicted oxidoreductase
MQTLPLGRSGLDVSRLCLGGCAATRMKCAEYP